MVVNRLLGFDRPLGTFSARIDLAFAVGLIAPTEHRDLHLVREIQEQPELG
jgi:hypothetical protein